MTFASQNPSARWQSQSEAHKRSGNRWWWCTYTDVNCRETWTAAANQRIKERHPIKSFFVRYFFILLLLIIPCVYISNDIPLPSYSLHQLPIPWHPTSHLPLCYPPISRLISSSLLPVWECFPSHPLHPASPLHDTPTLGHQTSLRTRAFPLVAVTQGHYLLHMYLEPNILLGTFLGWGSCLWEICVGMPVYVVLQMGL